MIMKSSAPGWPPLRGRSLNVLLFTKSLARLRGLFYCDYPSPASLRISM
jgi:hypothetical protein